MHFFGFGVVLGSGMIWERGGAYLVGFFGEVWVFCDIWHGPEFFGPWLVL